MSKQDRQGARTPADLEYRYAFGKSFAEVMGIATDARNYAEEAKKVSASVKETNDGIEVRVKSLEDNAGGEVALEIVEEGGRKYSQLRSDVDKIKFGAGEITIESENFTLDEDGNAKFSGELEAATGTFSGNIKSESEQTFGGTHTAELADGIVKIHSPTATVKDGIIYVPVLELYHGEEVYVLAFILNTDGSAAAVVKNKDFFATSA